MLPTNAYASDQAGALQRLQEETHRKLSETVMARIEALPLDAECKARLRKAAAKMDLRILEAMVGVVTAALSDLDYFVPVLDCQTQPSAA